ncbi:hypothetical protein ACFO4L_14680 [Bacillus daqingensis]|uniref:ATP-grasp domain-containing protein n=1 Tax=Bacillus daqingensis TaxID=872396 RepID=A0ABV9NWY7_9BACI
MNPAQWPPHLPAAVVHQAQGPLLCGYLIALEGWRRGLTLQFHAHKSQAFADIPFWYSHRPGRLFTLSDGKRTVRFFRSRGDGVSREAVEAGADKTRTKQYLHQADVPAPRGSLLESESDLAVEAGKLAGPFVLKVNDGSFGRGVRTNLSADELVGVYRELQQEHPGEPVLLEEHIEGPEYRLYVVGEHVAGAVRRDPASVTGDGNATIEELIARKNGERRSNPRLATALIKLDTAVEAMLQGQGLKLDSRPPAGQVVALRTQSNVSLGGDPVDVLDQLPDDMKQTAVRALQAFPEFPHGGVDIIHSNERGPVVLEVNPTAQIALMVFPMHGKGRDIPKAIVDYYFPETKQHTRASHAYFHLQDSLMALETGVASVSEVPDCPSEEPQGIHWVIEKPLHAAERHQIYVEAMERRLNGWLKPKGVDRWHVFAAGDEAEAFGASLPDAKEAGRGPAFITPAFRVYESREELLRDQAEVTTLISRTAAARRRTEQTLKLLRTTAGLPGKLKLLSKRGT